MMNKNLIFQEFSDESLSDDEFHDCSGQAIPKAQMNAAPSSNERQRTKNSISAKIKNLEISQGAIKKPPRTSEDKGGFSHVNYSTSQPPKKTKPVFIGNSNLREVKSGNTDFNILILGETGVGKSTFINSFMNYLSYKEFDIAEEEDILALIPSVFTIYNENYEELVIKIGFESNEYLETGASATQGTKSYVFPLNGDARLRLIDTPGIGDTRGIEQDNKNFENILSYIAQFEYLNAICILLKPNNTRLNVLFEFCIKQLLTHLDKSASDNIVFVFTNSRTTFYRPGETKPILSKLLDSIKQRPPFVHIPFERKNTFCLDNEAFRFLVACKSGVQFSTKEKENFVSSWDISVEECASRTTFYRPGETKPILSKLLDSIKQRPPFVHIPFERKNTFCLDNEAFRFLVACKSGVQFSTKEKENFVSSWDISVEECARMLEYIINHDQNGLKPHKVKDTLSVNDIRRKIFQLSKPLADIHQLIQDNIEVLNSHRIKIKGYEQNKKQLEETLYIPVVNLRKIDLDQPVTVCTALKCCQVFNIGDRKIYDFVKRCHEPCYLKQVPKEIIGTPELSQCYAMNSKGMCKHCGCPFKMHMHVYYMAERYEDKAEDSNIKTMMLQNDSTKKKLEIHTASIEKRIKEYNEEHAIITKAMAKFGQFIKIHSITPYNDAYENYLNHLIAQQENRGGLQDRKLVENYKKSVQQYKQEVKILEEALNMASGETIDLSETEIMKIFTSLFALKHCGADLKSLFKKQNKLIKIEHSGMEYHYRADGTMNNIKEKVKAKYLSAKKYFMNLIGEANTESKYKSKQKRHHY